MTQEEKAKAYDEALEYAHYLINERCKEGTNGSFYRADLQKMFPKLIESEDERTWIINYLSYRKLNSSIIAEKENLKKAIAWLEKQGEKGINGNNREIPNSEQKPVDNVEPKFKVGDTIRPRDPVLGEPRIIKGIHPKFGYDTNKGILDFEFEDNWELVEQKPAWSEEDEDILNTIINHFEIDLECTENDDIIRWLKSLRPQNTWKPNDEQMKALADALSLANNCGEENAFDLRTLYEQLKKLREE